MSFLILLGSRKETAFTTAMAAGELSPKGLGVIEAILDGGPSCYLDEDVGGRVVDATQTAYIYK